MKKKTVDKSGSLATVPQPAQLDAVRKLSRTGQYKQAHTRLAELRARFPDFKPLLPLAWEVANNAGAALNACLHAQDWVTASPNSLSALEALRDSAFDAGFLALSASAAQKLAHAQGASFSVPPIPEELSPLAFDQTVALDRSRLFITAGRFEAATAGLQGMDHPVARNNLAIALFGQGSVAAALACVEESWRRDNRNAFALQHLARLRLWSGGRGAASEIEIALRDMQPLRPEDAYTKIFSLSMLGADSDTIASWLAIADADFWRRDDRVERSSCAYFAGLAALRTDQPDAAGKFFSDALSLYSGNLEAEKASMLLATDSIDQEGDFGVGVFGDWFPHSWQAAFQRVKGTHAESILQAQQRRCDAHEDYLAAAAEAGGSVVRSYAIGILKLRALDGDIAAREVLRQLVVRPCGPDKVRIELLWWLEENNLVDPGKARNVLHFGEVRELLVRRMKLHANQKGTGLPASSQARFVQTHQMIQRVDLEGALPIAEALAAKHPGHALLVTHVAHIKDALWHDIGEIEALFRYAALLDPDYLFAQIGLCRIAARRGELSVARELLKPLLGRPEYHFTEWRAILAAQREIAVAEEDIGSIRTLDRALSDLEAQFG